MQRAESESHRVVLLLILGGGVLMGVVSKALMFLALLAVATWIVLNLYPPHI